ncbi:MAG: DMT family transporter [Candidatus Methanoplasma sp.]|nr:DMT family transporter [Candidatus Methanoplasma sp.]
MQDRKKRIKYGYLMAIFCALFWGIWYVPGTFVWIIDPFMAVQDAIIDAGHSADASFLATAVFITGLNALTVMLALTIWNLYLGKFREMRRTIVELKSCTKYFFFGAICGGPMAILGSFIAMGFIGGAFAAVAALAYPVIGTLISSTWLGQKVSRRALAGILIIIMGSITIYATGLYDDFTSGEARIWGYVGGVMALLGWGIEGAVAAKGIDVSEPDVAIQIRFLLETLIWWVIAIPALLILGFPLLTNAMELFSPVVLATLVLLGITFGFCYVSWYKSFPLIGVGRGQGIGSLYGVFAVIFLFIFTGDSPGIWLAAGAILCVVGTILMFTEDSGNLECLRESDGGCAEREESP